MKRNRSIATTTITFLLLTHGGAHAQTWTQVAEYTGEARWGTAGFALLGKGYVGTGANIDGGQLSDFFRYDPATDSWAQVADCGGNPRNYAVAVAANGKGYCGFGLIGDADWWEYDPNTDQWTQKADLPGGARYSPVGFAIAGKIYVATGGGCGGFCNDLWEYDPATDAWTQKADLPATGRYSAVGFSIDTKGYVTTGTHGFQMNDLWEYSPANDAWTQRANLPAQGRYQSMAFTFAGRGFVIGGLDEANNATDEVWAYSPGSDSWDPIDDFPGLGMFQGATFVAQGAAYVVTGGYQWGSVDCWKFQGSPLGVEAQEAPRVELYPNPADRFLHIRSLARPAAAYCTNALGQRAAVELHGDLIDLSVLASGAYRMELAWPGGQRSAHPVIRR